MSSIAVPEPTAGPALSVPGTAETGQRLVWLDIVRLLSALMILGIHWLRACFKVGLFGTGDAVNLVIGYQGQTIGLRMLPKVLIAGTGASLATWLTNFIGLLGGFGWEGVSALIIVSGFSLTLALDGKTLTPSGWLKWLQKRALRIMIPFYLVALPFLIAYLALLSTAAHIHGAFARSLDAKLHGVLQTPPLGVALSHTLLFDPFARQWQADFFAPAWWFVPAILLAYVAYTALLPAVRRFHWLPVLLVSAVVSIVSYRLADTHVLMNESCYYIVLQECFNLTLGIVIGNAWLNAASRTRIKRVLFDRSIIVPAMLLFLAGNVANWSPATRPIASILFGPALVVTLVAIAKRLERTRVAEVAERTDAYGLYLVHQPFAFPVALVAKSVFHGYAVFLGWFAFVAVAGIATSVLNFGQRFIALRTQQRDRSRP